MKTTLEMFSNHIVLLVLRLLGESPHTLRKCFWHWVAQAHPLLGVRMWANFSHEACVCPSLPISIDTEERVPCGPRVAALITSPPNLIIGTQFLLKIYLMLNYVRHIYPNISFI